MCIYCKERCFLLSDIILINSNPNNKHLLNRNFVYINEREVVQNVKITCAASDINHKCIWSKSIVTSKGYRERETSLALLKREGTFSGLALLASQKWWFWLQKQWH